MATNVLNFHVKNHKTTVKPGNLKQFFPFTELPPEYVIVAASFADEVAYADGSIVLDANSEDPHDFFLLAGEVSVVDIYGSETVLEAGCSEATQPLPQLRPSANTIRSRGVSRIIKIAQEVIRRVRAEAPTRDPALEEDITLDITQSREFFNDFKEELQMNRVRLPSLGHSASRIHRLLSAGDVAAEALIPAVAGDPAIAAKLLKMANSSLFIADGKVRDLGAIVSRLGVHESREIAACFAFRDVFKNASSELVDRLQAQVTQAQQVSAMSAAIAEIGGHVEPGVAALAGLVNNVGILPIFSYAMHNVAYAMNPGLVDRAIEKMSQKTGVLLAKKWRFSDEIIECIEHANDWSYQADDASSLVHIVLTARYHYQLSHSGIKTLPKPRQVPSLAAAMAGPFDEKISLQILGRARQLMSANAATASC